YPCFHSTPGYQPPYQRKGETDSNCLWCCGGSVSARKALSLLVLLVSSIFVDNIPLQDGISEWLVERSQNLMTSSISSCLLLVLMPLIPNGTERPKVAGKQTLNQWCQVPKHLENRILWEEAVKELALSPIRYAGSWSLRQRTDAYVSAYLPWLVIELHCRVD